MPIKFSLVSKSSLSFIRPTDSLRSSLCGLIPAIIEESLLLAALPGAPFPPGQPIPAIPLPAAAPSQGLTPNPIAPPIPAAAPYLAALPAVRPVALVPRPSAFKILNANAAAIYFLPLGSGAPDLPTYSPKNAAPAPTIVDMKAACALVGASRAMNHVVD